MHIGRLKSLKITYLGNYIKTHSSDTNSDIRPRTHVRRDSLFIYAKDWVLD